MNRGSSDEPGRRDQIHDQLLHLLEPRVVLGLEELEDDGFVRGHETADLLHSLDSKINKMNIFF